MALSDDFGTLALGAKWNFFRPAADERSRARVADGALIMTARGNATVDSSPLLTTAGDQASRFECAIEIEPGGTAVLIFLYDDRHHCCPGFAAEGFVTYHFVIVPDSAQPLGRYRHG